MTLLGKANSSHAADQETYVAIPILEAGARTGNSTTDIRAGIGVGDTGDPMFTLQSGKQHAIAFSSKDYGADAGPLSPTLRACGHSGSHANAGGPPAIAFHPTQDPISSTDGSVHALGTGSSKGSATGAVAIGFQDDTTPKTSEERIGAIRADAGGQGACVQQELSVRRLTPTECERLQGFPDDWTLIPSKFRPRKAQDHIETVAYLVHHGLSLQDAELLADAPDGPRYKAIGNSMAVPCMAWIGRGIARVNTAITPLDIDFG